MRYQHQQLIEAKAYKTLEKAAQAEATTISRITSK
jgi:hypothetical protein